MQGQANQNHEQPSAHINTNDKQSLVGRLLQTSNIWRQRLDNFRTARVDKLDAIDRKPRRRGDWTLDIDESEIL